jgi:acetyltransferase-like isoleucine patch superfamily enzyme
MSLWSAIAHPWEALQGRRSRRAVSHLVGSLASCGAGVTVPADCCVTSPETVHIGNDVSIGSGVWLSAVNARITIGNKVMLAPGVAIICGDHHIGTVGRYMFDVKDKAPEDDQPIVIQDDVWVGFRAIVLKGVTLGRGCVVGAGSVVTRDVPAYAIVAGVPARVVGARFSESQVREHEALLGLSPGTPRA